MFPWTSLRVAAVLLLLLACLETSMCTSHNVPVEDLTTDEVESRASQPHLRQERQEDDSEGSRFQQIPLRPCSNNTDCYPVEYREEMIPHDLIQCNNSFCMCEQCFVRLHDVCSVADCHTYLEPDRKCQDNRRSQKTAFLLSIFLSSVGAANFYIAEHGIAIGQLALFIVLLLAVYALICVPCWLLICMDEDDFDEAIESMKFICFVILMVLLVLVCLLAIFCWWVADLVIFVQNGRSAGDDGCPLKPDL